MYGGQQVNASQGKGAKEEPGGAIGLRLGAQLQHVGPARKEGPRDEAKLRKVRT